MIVVDDNLNLGFAVTTGGGGYGGGPFEWGGINGGGVVQVTTADTIHQLRGIGSQTGGSVIGGPDLGDAVGAELVIQKGSVVGVDINVGVGANVPLPFEMHGMVGKTWVGGVNLWDVMNPSAGCCSGY
jgi:hypothetical protein